MYVNISGFQAIERVKKVHHTTVINRVKEVVQREQGTGNREQKKLMFKNMRLK